MSEIEQTKEMIARIRSECEKLDEQINALCKENSDIEKIKKPNYISGRYGNELQRCRY